MTEETDFETYLYLSNNEFKIFLFDKGELKHEGNYQDLLENSDKFRLSVKNS